MARIRRSPIGLLGWTSAITLVVAAVAFAILAFNLLGAPPERPEGSDWVDFVVSRLAWDRERQPLETLARLLFAVSFFALAGIGVVLGRSWSSSRDRGSLLAASFVVAGALGAAAELIHIGAIEVATDPTICDCGYRAEEIVGRLQAFQATNMGATWLSRGAVVAAFPGFLLASALGREAGWEGWWRALSIGIGVLFLVGVALALLDQNLASDLALLVTVGVLAPAWAVGLAGRDLEPA